MSSITDLTVHICKSLIAQAALINIFMKIVDQKMILNVKSVI